MLEASNLDPKALMQVRIAALVAVDAPLALYPMNLGAASELGVDADGVRDLLAAIAPIVGTARTVAALGNLVRALGLALEMADDADDASYTRVVTRVGAGRGRAGPGRRPAVTG